MKRLLCFLILPVLMMVQTAPLRAAVTLLDGLSTQAAAPAPAASLSSATSFNVDLSDRTGLTPGAPVMITLVSTADTLWTGGFQLAGGPTTANVTGTLELLAGGKSAFSQVSVWHFEGNVPAPDPATSNIVGFNQGQRFATLSLIVPWDTDLSAISVRLSQSSSFSGGGFFNSNVYTSAAAGAASAMQIQLQSVPEPGSLVLCAGSLGLLAVRRRR